MLSLRGILREAYMPMGGYMCRSTPDPSGLKSLTMTPDLGFVRTQALLATVPPAL
jgi:hypothetical protein